MREIRRVIFNRVTIFLLILLTAIGAVLFWLHTKSSIVSKEYTEVFTKAYHELLDEFSAVPPEQITDEQIEDRMTLYRVLGVLAHHINIYGVDDELKEMIEEDPDFAEIYGSVDLTPYFDNLILAQAQENAIELISEQVDYLCDFNAYYPAIKSNAERMQHTSIFGDPNSFAYRNTIKTVKDFEAIDGARGTLGDDRAVTSVFDDPIVDYLMLIFMMLVSVLMLKERKSGLWQLVRSTPNGRAGLAGSRIAALLAAALLATVFIFGSRLVISYLTYDGMAYGSRLIQSVKGFNGIPVPMKVNDFVLLYCGVKFICTFISGLFVFMLLSSVKNLNIAIVITGAVLAAEFGLSTAVRDNSILVPFKYVNVMRVVVPKDLVVNYLNLNFFEHPVNTRVAVSAVLLVLAAAAAVGIILVHMHKRPVGKPHPLERLIDKIRRRTYKRVFMQETGKALFAQRGILVMFALVYVFFTFGSLPEPSVTEEQSSIPSYYEKYAGSVSEDTILSIDRDIEEIEAMIPGAEDSFARMIFTKTLDGLEYLEGEVRDIIERNASGEYPNEIKLLPPYTYMIAFGEGSLSFGTIQALKALLGIVLLTAGLYAYEKQSSMTRLLRSLPKGRGRLFLRKELLTLAFSVIVFAAVYLPEILALAGSERYGGFTCFNYPIQGLTILRESRLSLSVGGLTVLFYLARLLAIFLVGSAVGLISTLNERSNTSLVMSSAVMVLPACVAAMGVESLFNYTPLTVLWGSGGFFYGDVIPYAVHVALLLLMTAANYVVNCRPHLFGKGQRNK
ncbi:MAG: hypothetical protein IKG85_06050 [Clostridia bacterium]|nr:hypothetical protein [Clostridia bacterium]